jgi:hypothetical protein
VSSRSASTWVTIASHVFTSMPTMRVVAKFVFMFSMPWRPSDKLASRWIVSSALGASQRSSGPLVVRLGRLASGRRRRLTSTDHLIPSSSYSTTQSPSGRPEATGASWPTSSRWLQRESLAGGSGSCPRSPSCLGEVSTSSSSTSSLPWGQSPRVRRGSRLSAASSSEHKKLRLRAWGLWRPAIS